MENGCKLNMKIAFVIYSFPTLSETFILNQITGLIRLGNDVTIFAGDHPKESKMHADVEKYKLLDKVQYFDIPQKRVPRTVKGLYLIAKNILKRSRAIFKALNIIRYGRDVLDLIFVYLAVYPYKDKEFDIIHCHFGPNGNMGLFLKDIGFKGEVATTFHGFDLSSAIRQRGKKIYSHLFSYGDLFLPISDHWKKRLIQLGCPIEKIKVHHMGIDISRFDSRIRSDDKECFTILTVGRLVEKKCHECAIKVVSRLVDHKINFQYLIAGEGPLKNKLESLVLELNIKDRVKFLGAVDQEDVIKLYQQADVFFLPSITGKDGDQEGIPVVLMEAMAMGLAIVSSKHSGIPELVQEGISGFLLDEGDIDGLADRLKYLMEQPEIRHRFGENGRCFVHKHYNINYLNSRLDDIFSDMDRS